LHWHQLKKRKTIGYVNTSKQSELKVQQKSFAKFTRFKKHKITEKMSKI